jgi:DNA repair protein RadD
LDFAAFLTRADDQTLQSLLGAKTIRLANALGGEAAGISRIRELLLNLKSPQQLLAEKQARSTLLDLLRPPEARVLAEILGLQAKDPYATLKSANMGQERLGHAACAA